MSVPPPAGKAISGGFVRLDPATRAVTQILPFQRQPRLLARTLSGGSPPSAGQEPQETIVFRLPLEIDRQAAASNAEGLSPWISAFELLLYASPEPGSSPPIILFVWGQRRILPVRVSDLHITETAFDARLTPVAAELEITLQVLKDADLPLDSPSRVLWDAHFRMLETEAAQLSATLGDLGLTTIL